MFPTLQATVLQKNTANAYVCDPCGGYGRTLPIPCGTAAQVEGQYWATPQKEPYFQGFKYTIASEAPTEDSFEVFKLINTITGDYYMVMGTIAAYSAACGACCDASPVPTLVVDPADLPDMASCQDTCTTNGTDYDGFWAVQVPLGGGNEYYARVEVDGALVWQQTSGSASIAALIIALNANAASAGTWSNPDEQAIRLRTTEKKKVCFIACIREA